MWGVLPLRDASRHDRGARLTDPPARAKCSVTDYAEYLDRKAWVDRVHVYGGHSQTVSHAEYLHISTRAV